MTARSGMTVEECELHIGECVRINRFDGKNQHRGRGKLMGVEGRKVRVLPFGGHRKEELMDPKILSLWKSRNIQNHEIQINRLFDDADPEVVALLSKKDLYKIKGANDHNNPKRCKGKKEHRPAVQMTALPPESNNRQFSPTPPVQKQAPLPVQKQIPPMISRVYPQLIAKHTVGPPIQEERVSTMKKKEWLRKHCGIVFDCLVNGVQETFHGPQHKASAEATERILQTLIGDARFVGLDDAVLPKAIPLINEFASDELDKDAGAITRSDLEDLLVEKQIIKLQDRIDPLVEIKSGNLDKKEVLRALIGSNGFKSTSELATFVLRELRGVTVD